jgi:hypothetical protein
LSLQIQKYTNNLFYNIVSHRCNKVFQTYNNIKSKDASKYILEEEKKREKKLQEKINERVAENQNDIMNLIDMEAKRNGTGLFQPESTFKFPYEDEMNRYYEQKKQIRRYEERNEKIRNEHNIHLKRFRQYKKEKIAGYTQQT